EVQMTRAGVLVHAGDNRAAETAIDVAVGLLTEVPLARAMVQRGAMRTAVGSLDPALEDFATAERMLEAADDDLWRAHLGVNRAIVLAYKGDYARSRDEFEDARRRYTALGHRQSVAEIAQNLGWLAARSGDLAAAFRHFDRAEAEYRAIDAGLGYLWIHRCWALLACHLAAEARALARRAADALTRTGFGLAGAEAMAMQAEAALLDGAPQEALQVARSAREVFEEQGRPAWAAYATYLALRARFDLGDLGTQDLEAVRAAASALEDAGMRDLALHARLLDGRTALLLGDTAGGAADLEAAAQTRRVGSVSLRVQAWLATALLRLDQGNRSGAAFAIRAGMAIADEYGAALGALEARAGVAAHAAELTGLGLHLAPESGRSRSIFEWMERSRARALDFPPVVPPDDAELAALLARLRVTEGELRRATLDGEDSTRLRRESSGLQEQVRALNLGTSATSTPVRRTALTQRLLAELDSRCLVELAVDAGEVHAIVLRENRVEHRRLGRLDTMVHALEGLRFALTRLARPGGSEASRASAQLMVDDATTSLDQAVLAAVGGTDGAAEMVIVPPAELFPVPWAMLPSLAARTVTVSPAARLWLDRHRPLPDAGSVVVVGGPGVPGGADETRRISRLYGDVRRFTARDSKVEAVLQALDGARIAHFVAHGSFRWDNPLFSSLRLADGDLTVYDLTRVSRLPPVIVLSACNAGIVATRPGNETMGMVAGLLDAGVRTVIASTGLVPDTALTTGAMVDLHRRVVGGEAPAQALAAVQAKALARPDGFAAGTFVCFGVG
ncbi:MAG: CHAT domain-containing protein, partial [Actinomycetota bacterium]|nr:CHAT domain-containing protein [Actinomycetota bacterium]